MTSSERNLVQAAIDVRKKAYAPYSKFNVGAALLTGDGNVFVGCNVENSSYGLAICAERNTIGAMVAAGGRTIKTIAVAASPLASPCGACRQVIVEFGDEIEIISVNPDQIEEYSRWRITDLLPDHFQFKQ